MAGKRRSPAVGELQRADDVEGALAILLEHFGQVDPVLAAVTVINAYRSCAGAEL
ncbi:hypothetical protein YA0010_10800 [Pseudomonas syringae]|uniref:hypothetical protein n=1 Tax=Pseudomonas syringae TaxID=317 RepID=UPI0018E6067A|nr:hypothetical protein [Pseudomonas syringae]MBI6847559.1 hypothetical protein [Pseudomonas syringae]